MSDATRPAVMASKSPLFREYAKEPASISPLFLSLSDSNSSGQGESKPLLRKDHSSYMGRRVDRDYVADHHPSQQPLIYTDLKASVAESNKRHSGRRHLDGRLKAASVRSNIIRRYDSNSFVDTSSSRESEDGEQYMPQSVTRSGLKQRRTSSTQQARNVNNKLITRHSMISNLESVGNGILWSLVLLPILITMGMFMLSQANKDKTTVIELPFSNRTFTTWPNERVHHDLDHDHVHISSIAPTDTSYRYSFDLHQGRVEYLGYIRSYLTITPDAMATLRRSSTGRSHTLLVEVELVVPSPPPPQGNSTAALLLPVPPPPPPLLLLLSSVVVPIAAANSFYSEEETTTVTPVIIPLPIITFDRPNIFFNLLDHSGQDMMKVRYTVQWIADGEADATVSDASRSFSTSIPSSISSSISSPAPISITVMTQNTSNLWAFALVQLTASVALLALLAYYIFSIVSYSRQLLLSEQQQLLQRHQLLQYSKEGSCDDGRSVGATFMHYIIPEQYTVVALLSLLVLWVDPLQSICLLSMLHGIKVSTHMLFITALIKDLSHFGLYCCLLTYIDGLGHRTAARDSSDDDVRLAQLTKQFTDISSYRSLRSVYDPFVDTSSSSSSSSSAASAVKSTVTRRSDMQQQYDYWRRDDAAYVQSSLLRLKRLDHINLLQSLYVVSHHPFSIEFLEFVFYKLLLLVVTCLLVVLYWFLVTITITTTDNDVTVRWQLTTEQLTGSYTCVKIALFCAHVLWIFLILQSLLSTGYRLKRTIFMRSRFRQLAFRLLVFQGNTSLLLFLIICIWYMTFQSGLYEGVHFPSLYALLSFHYQWLQHIGFYRSFISCGFPLAYLDVESVVFLTSIICTIMYCMLPPAMLVLDRYGNVLNTNQHSFVTLCKYIPPTKDLSRDRSYQYAKMKVMRHLLRLMTVEDASGSYSVFMKLYLASVHDKKTHAEEEEEAVFCLETALILLEVCYQTYFPLTRDETVVESPSPVRGSYGAISPQQHTINSSSNSNSSSSSGSSSSGSFKLITPPSRSDRKADSVSSRRALNPFDDDDVDDDDDGKGDGNEKGQRTHVEDTIAADLSSTVKGVPNRSMNPFDPAYIDIIDDMTKINKTKKGEEEGLGVDSTMPSTNPAMGPKLNVSSLGFQLKASFTCQTLSTFGILCTCDNTIVVSFRGSQAANISTDLKFVQMALPRLKRPISFFVRTLKLISSSGSCSNSGSKKRHSLSEELLIDGDGGVYDDDDDDNHDYDDESDYDGDNDDNDSVRIDFSSEKMDDFQSDDDEDMQDGVDTDDANYFDTQDVHNFSSLSTKANLFLAKSKKLVKQKVSDLGTKVPLVNQSFARVHVGFWEAYSSIREDFMRAVIKAIYLHRKEFMERSRSSVSASPSSAFLYSCGDEESSSTSTLKNNRQQQQSFSNLNSILDIYFCGHSLGAAIASLAALELASNMDLIMEALCREDIFEHPRAHASLLLPAVLSYPAPQLSLYMYGSPRIGNARFAYYIRRKVKAIYRIQVNGDIVAMLPKFIGFYRHIGTAIIIDDDDAGNIIVNPSIIESYMLLRNTGSFLNHSLEVYRSCLEACFDKFELSEYLTQELR